MLARHELNSLNTKTTVVFLHGFWGRSADWIPVAAHLPFKSIGFDLPGHGNTPFFPEVLDALRRAIAPLSPVHLVGYSMGGRIALSFFHTYREQVSSLTLLGAHPGIADAQEREKRLAADKRFAQEILQRPIDELIAEWYDRPLFGALSFKRDLWTMRHTQNREGLAQALVTFSLGLQPDFSNLLPSCSLLVGEEDTTYRRLYASWPHQLIQEAAHAAHLENPAGVAAALSRSCL
jgi:2-succinyl-6-hydroxy-2,4-cyclohexadiene-1-carboxylate synthase